MKASLYLRDLVHLKDQLDNCLRRGSSLSRSQSPIKFSDITVRKMAKPGKNEIHHASRR